jgi:hypothetical protein
VLQTTKRVGTTDHSLSAGLEILIAEFPYITTFRTPSVNSVGFRRELPPQQLTNVSNPPGRARPAHGLRTPSVGH